jgi:hypothetical protein
MSRSILKRFLSTLAPDRTRPAPRPRRHGLRLEILEDRCTPSAGGGHATLPAAPVVVQVAGSQNTDLPFKEHLTLVGSAPGEAFYVGNATHLGKVSATEYINPAFDPNDPTSVFATYVKTAANGDTVVGTIIPDDPANPFTTGSLTIDGGTGRFDGATGTSRYVISADPKTGAPAADITGTISYGHAAPSAAAASSAGDVRVVPFKITGGGLATGLPLFPGGTAPHPATGNATELGKYTGEGTFELGTINISPTGAVSGTFQGSFVFVAANGDRLAMKYGDGFTGTFTGQLSADGTTVNDVTFDAFFTPDPANSTGRFADVVGGGFRMIAHADSASLISDVPGYTAPFDYTWSGEGTLVYRKGK